MSCITTKHECFNCKHSMDNKPNGELCIIEECDETFNHWEAIGTIELPTTKTIDSIYAIRKLGRDYCQTEGSKHYKASDNIEPAEYAMANGTFEDWAITNVVKYITRFKVTRNKDDLKKVTDFAHLLCGIEINKEE